MTGQLALQLPTTVQSVVTSRLNAELIATVAQLWIDDDDLVVDCTYGRGRFWDRYRPHRLVAHDLALDGVDFRRLPEADSSVDVVVLDPPYIVQGGRETSTIRAVSGTRANVTTDGDGFLERYGLVDGPRTVAELEQLFTDGIAECTRVLAPRGRLLVKCMDFVSSGRFVTMRRHVCDTAEAAGLEQVDEFVHASGLGPQPVRPDRQQHSRRAHSFLCVFQAPGRRP